MCFELPWLDSRRRRVVFAQNLVAHCPGRCGFAPFLVIAADDAASDHFFCAALIFAQRALAALLIAALAEALIVNFFGGVGLLGPPVASPPSGAVGPRPSSPGSPH